MKDGQNLKIGDAHVTPKKYPRSTSVKVWAGPRHPLLHQQNYQVIFLDTIFLFLHMICVILGASIFFLLSVLFCFLAVINGWILAFQVGERHAPFSLPRTLQFSLLFICECSVFASTAFSSCFSLKFCSELVGFLKLYMINSLVFDDYFL